MYFISSFGKKMGKAGMLKTLGLAGAMALSGHGFSQSTQNVTNQTKNIIHMTLNPKQATDSLAPYIKKHLDKYGVKETYEQIVTMKVGDIQKKYGIEKTNNICAKLLFYETLIQRAKEDSTLRFLSYDTTLCKVSTIWAQTMKDSNRLGHYIDGKSSDDVGVDLSDYHVIRENIIDVDDEMTVRELVGYWMKPGKTKHRATMLAKDSRYLGPGFVFPYAVLNFGEKFRPY